MEYSSRAVLPFISNPIDRSADPMKNHAAGYNDLIDDNFEHHLFTMEHINELANK